MKTANVTITSKNQITVPAKMVRNMKLSRNRRLQVRQKGNDIILTPLPSLAEQLQPVWDKASKSVKNSLTDEQIQASVRTVAAKR